MEAYAQKGGEDQRWVRGKNKTGTNHEAQESWQHAIDEQNDQTQVNEEKRWERQEGTEWWQRQVHGTTGQTNAKEHEHETKQDEQQQAHQNTRTYKDI